MLKPFTPLRSVVGDALHCSLEVNSLSISAENAGLEIDLRPGSNALVVAQDAALLTYRPDIVIDTPDGRQTFRPDPHQQPFIETHPQASPFPIDAPFHSIYARSDATLDDDAHRERMSVTFTLRLKKPQLIGGIAFCGYPDLEYSIDRYGQSSSNYGLPREFQISLAAHEDGSRSERNFIDSDIHYTQQEMNHCSGFHFLHIEPTYARQLTLKVSDLPRLPRHILHRADGQIEVAESPRMVIPFLYLFSWKEQTRYQHFVPGGTVAVIAQRPMDKDEDAAPAAPVPPVAPIKGQWRRMLRQSKTYQTYSGSAPFRPAGGYHAKSNDPPTMGHSFVSDLVDADQSISIVCQQCDEFIRTLSGLELWIPIPSNIEKKLSLPASVQLPTQEITPIQRVGLRVYELDFPSGVSPLRCRNAELRKYKYLLSESVVAPNPDLTWNQMLEHLSTGSKPGASTVRFDRPSNQKYFEIELINLGKAPGQFVVMLAEWIQSAHISLHPKPGRHLQAQTLHFRLIGANLTDDYARLGEDDFTFTIEHTRAGEPVRNLLSIRNLADLMQSGHARILGNSRRRAVEFEKSNVYSPDASNPYAGLFPQETAENFEARQGDVNTHGWTLVEGGADVHKPDGKQLGDSYTTQESRAHTKHLYPETFVDPRGSVDSSGIIPSDHLISPWEAAANYLNLGHGLFTDALGTVSNWFLAGDDQSLLIPGPDRDPVTGRPASPLTYQFDYWRGVNTIPVVTGMQSVSMSPFSPVPITHQAVKDAFEGLKGLCSRITGVAQPDPLTTWGAITDLVASYQTLLPMFPGFLPATLPALAAFNAGNGLTVGGSVLFLSTSSSLLTPAFTYQHSFGSQGAISTSSSKTCYMRSETIRRTEDHSDTRSTVQAGENKRVIERREVPGTDQKRIRGAEVMWNGAALDIVLGQIPLDIAFSALAQQGSPSRDESLRVRFGNGIGPNIQVDFWFDVQETEISDDF